MGAAKSIATCLKSVMGLALLAVVAWSPAALAGAPAKAKPAKAAAAPRAMTFEVEGLSTDRLVPPVIVMTGVRRQTSRLITLRVHFLDALLKSADDLGL